jgi:hypothetical protein
MISKDQWIRLCAEVCGADDASTEDERKTFMKVATRARFRIEEISARLKIGAPDESS